jgi:hypothetical protein
MMKVRILDCCEFCDGEAYVFVCEDVDARGETFDRYRPCEMCHGSGNRAKWVGLRESTDVINRAMSLEPNSQGHRLVRTSILLLACFSHNEKTFLFQEG